MKAMITGVTGFAGSHLAEFLLERGDYEVSGIDVPGCGLEKIEPIRQKVDLIECDIRNALSLTKALKSAGPDRIFHLAAQAFVRTSWQSPAETMNTNLVGTLNLFEAVRSIGLDCRILAAGSSDEYGKTGDSPVDETCPLRPLSPYGVSKAAQNLLAYQYCQSYSLDIVCTRAFIHTGIRSPEVYVASNFAKQIAEIEAGLKQPVLLVGNLEAVRDFCHVKDMVRGYSLALEKGEGGATYNICSGRGLSIRQVLDMLLEMTDAPIEVRQDPDRLRPSDITTLVGDCSRFRKATGWKPEIPFEQALRELLDDWRNRLGRP